MKYLILIWLITTCFSLTWGQTNPLNNLINDAKNEGYQFENASGVINDAKKSLLTVSSKNLNSTEKLSVFYYDSEKFPSNGYTLSLSIPTFELGTLEIELIEREGINEQVIIKKSSEIEDNSEPNLLAKHYRGVVKNYEGSLVALSVFDNEITGIISIAGIGDFNIAKQKNSEAHVVINTNNVQDTTPTTCGAINSNFQPQIASKNTQLSAENATTKCPSIFFEVDHDIFNHFNGSVTDTENYVTALFNEVATIYEMENINLNISEIFIWTTEDPYTYNDGNVNSTDLGNLNIFQDNYKRIGFNGDVAHLLTLTEGIGTGGVANIGPTAASFGVTNLGNTSAVGDLYGNFPRRVFIVVHELGHNFGSVHTHNCSWNGNNTQIDDYGNVDSTTGSLLSDSEGIKGGCIDPLDTSYIPLLDVTPTIMSYYNGASSLTLANGFGQQPGDLIRNNILSSSFYTTCESESNCPLVENVTNNVNNGSTDTQVAATQLIASNTIFNGGTAFYHAGDEVVLTDGFLAEFGSVFYGYIEGCDASTSSRIINQTDISEAPEQQLLEEITDPNLSIYPNPSSGLFTIQSNDQIVSYSVINIIGIQIITNEVNNSEFIIDITKLVNGIYFLEVQKDNGEIIRSKIIKD